MTRTLEYIPDNDHACAGVSTFLAPIGGDQYRVTSHRACGCDTPLCSVFELCDLHACLPVGIVVEVPAQAFDWVSSEGEPLPARREPGGTRLSPWGLYDLYQYATQPL